MKLDIAPFAYAAPDEHGIHTWRWEEPREIHRVVLRFAAGNLPQARDIKVAYWQKVWPEHRVTEQDVRNLAALAHALVLALGFGTGAVVWWYWGMATPLVFVFALEFALAFYGRNHFERAHFLFRLLGDFRYPYWLMVLCKR